MKGIKRLSLMTAVAAVSTLAGFGAQVSREEALKQVYPNAVIEGEQIFLTEGQQLAAGRLADVEVPSRLVARYVATRNGEIVGRAYVDTHTVRTKNESLLVCLGADGRIRRVEVTAFLEPSEYMGSDLWYRQYDGRVLDDDLEIDRAIRPVVGATLTGRATSAAIRRVLAIDAVLGGSGGTQP